jgi:UDP-N-acetylmuramoyl-tripeptide--D-alanyl-D-alanine ligase
MDGHDFLPDAVSKKVKAVVVQTGRVREAPAEVAVIEVSDTLFALGELARYWRSRFSIPVIGVTGSNGKTSTKEMVAGILGQNADILKNQGNFNNLIGVPLTLLSLQPRHQMAVVEMGINVPGEMARLTEICRPNAGLITNIHSAHLEGLQSLDHVLAEKGKLWEGLGSDDLAVVNQDDERLAALAKSVRARKIGYSLKDPAARVHLHGEVETRELASHFQITLGEETISVRLPVLGLHQVQNAVAAAAAAYGLGMSPDVIARGLSLHQPVKQRMQVYRLDDGVVLVDDTYNANPSSMQAALKAVAGACLGKPFLAVLGEMRELGTESAALHREVGRMLGALGANKVITLGDLAAEIGAGAREAGLSSSACYHASSHEDAVLRLKSHWVEDAWILVKGSRGMTMERVVKGILNDAA